jgi:DNA modification methylase
MDWQKYCDRENWHEEAMLLPLVKADDLPALADDIKKHGLQEPIVLFEGKVLDGRNRLRACKQKGISLKSAHFIQFQPNGLSARDFVITKNLHRRQLTLDQRAALAAELVPMFEEEAKKRVGGRPKKGQKPSAEVRPVKGKSSELAARFVGGVGERSVEKVLSLERKARDKGKRDVLARIKEGRLTIADAEREIDELYTDKEGLAKRLGAKPFTLWDDSIVDSVLYARKGEWQKRKSDWKKLGIYGGHNEQKGRTTFGETHSKQFSKTSAFDAVLAEFVYDYFCPPQSHVLDPFAGEAIKGLVAAMKGHAYTGIDVREKQVQENRQKAGKLGLTPKPTWIRADSTKLDESLPKGESYDLVFTSPPYYDLEKYSCRDNKKDLSQLPTYEDFMQSYESIFRQAVTRLKSNRFLVIKVGEIRNKETGFYRNFVGDTVRCFLKLGLRYYNEAILATSEGTAGQRAGQFDSSRSLVHTHQNVLFFFKGDKKKSIPDALGLLPEKNGQ